ncbi:hypothetical protein PSHT_10517 [Puccinia striiformis]|uniref:Uncharacterized protein n=1 Tax=Puccinia striiformis TaxID=27350 RepID=A0A2S4V986_9BASI|nr:hypothetical protein PSHT_10517 [Puccinia striiformis]
MIYGNSVRHQTDGMPDEQGGSLLGNRSGSWLAEEMMQSGRTYELRRKSSLNHSDDESRTGGKKERN